jgi:hypothetical protein
MDAAEKDDKIIVGRSTTAAVLSLDLIDINSFHSAHF